ncbi:protein lin-52 homolog isoform X2 [Eurytemora carolleeae]|uniref:protein lin-52 homolog isoform X2 n=1 Tax=Eurytemora carolleeae TaxID=1294199 RepID=UPI000C794C96|nr:protein lin-52 homolog isoform X2 [Eurytemora carolleeae]|eukprot:XP_023326835.1 protein lin-52 homolog isoform X2 [Eurytemora affinis]
MSLVGDLLSDLGAENGADHNQSSSNHPILNSSLQVEAESDLEDLELSLRALEKLDRSSPDLWPEQIPGVNQFIPATPTTNQSSPSQPGEWLQGLTKDDMELLMQLGTLSVPDILNEVRKLQNLAYQLGQEESKEMTRY